MSDSLKVGEMRDYLKALTKVDTKSAGGLITSSWQYAFSFYASNESQKSVESFNNLIPGIRTSASWQTWLRNDLKRDMRVIFNDDQYNIINLTRGFKTMTIDCEKIEP